MHHPPLTDAGRRRRPQQAFTLTGPGSRLLVRRPLLGEAPVSGSV